MTEVSEQVYVTDKSWVEQHTLPDDVDRVITVCQEEVSAHIPVSVAYEWYQMSDGPSNRYGGDHSYRIFEMAAASMLRALEAGETVLIHCHAGQSRSVSVSSAALAAYNDSIRVMGYIYYIKDARGSGTLPDDSLIRYAKRFVEEYQDEI